jgi:hypothetical protein
MREQLSPPPLPQLLPQRLHGITFHKTYLDDDIVVAMNQSLSGPGLVYLIERCGPCIRRLRLPPITKDERKKLVLKKLAKHCTTGLLEEISVSCPPGDLEEVTRLWARVLQNNPRLRSVSLLHYPQCSEVFRWLGTCCPDLEECTLDFAYEREKPLPPRERTQWIRSRMPQVEEAVLVWQHLPPKLTVSVSIEESSTLVRLKK